MQNAIKAVELGDSIRHAAEMFNVPRSTLHNKIANAYMCIDVYVCN